jgi:NAD(P)-dependent dehydrogenase (short-subunit alcohol dehydrogenase family)
MGKAHRGNQCQGSINKLTNLWMQVRIRNWPGKRFKEKFDEYPSCLITGGLTGIGRATALAFANEGVHVVVSGRRDEEGQKLVSEIRKASAEADFIRADVRREEDVRNLIDKTVERFGRLDVAVNTAGTEGVNISSTFGHTGAPGASVYSASKHAVEGLTKSAALEAAGTGVRVNVIAPGPIETPMLNRFAKTDERKTGLVSNVPLKRAGKPEEIAQAILFVSSDKASFITGASYLVDGGKTAR